MKAKEVKFLVQWKLTYLSTFKISDLVGIVDGLFSDGARGLNLEKGFL